jgi:hypothetical protein
LDKQVKIEVKQIQNSDKFRTAALCFQKNNYYCSAPEGTSEWRKYWVEEAKRCLYGYSAPDGEYISGYFYFYLNYCRIARVKKEEIYNPRTKKTRIVTGRPDDFPLFYDYDKVYFDTINTAEEEGKHLAVLKSRGTGYSYKGAAMLCRNYYLVPGSKNYAIASEQEFLTRDGLLSKAWHYMDFIDEHTAWAKKRQKKDTITHKRASFVVDINGVKTEMGFMSEIIGISLKNDPDKARGKRAKLILWEEAGHFKDLIKSWIVARPSVEAGSDTFGLMILYGTGGESDANFEGLKNIFYEPEAFNCLPIENIWDDGMQGTRCGFFVPAYYNMEGLDADGKSFMDENGNSDVPRTLNYILKEREKLYDSSSDKSVIDRRIAEIPITPQEASLNVLGNIFPKKDLIRHLAMIRNNKDLLTFKQIGELQFDSKSQVNWVLSPKARDLTSYRVREGQNKEGAIVIWEHPVPNAPHSLYIAGVDSYDHDKSTTNSLGSCIIYKRFQNFESYYDLPVAEYTGRPDMAEDFYENVRKLLLYYRATCLYENEKKGIFSYFVHKHCDYLLADQPDIIRDIIQDTKVQRNKGIHMVKSIKDWMEGLIKDWLNEEYAPGKKNLTKILSEPLLEELISYNDEGNFDRVIAFGLCMIYREQLHNIKVKKFNEDDKSRFLFPEKMFLNIKKYGSYE